jgi:type I restriction enzyme M protein
MIQTEGFEAVKKVDPNLVIKKKKDKEEDVQDGWKGHILPFELVQKTLLKADYECLKNKENRVSEITSEYSEILGDMSEEDKNSEAINEAGDKFVNSVVLAKAKQIEFEIKNGTKFDDDSFELKLIKVARLISEEKRLNKEIKKETDELHIKTKTTIETLSDENAYMLLEKKWIEPLVLSITELPNDIIHTLSDKIKSLSEKYAVTLASVEKEIKEAENELSILINDLTGNEYDIKGLEALQALLNGD